MQTELNITDAVEKISVGGRFAVGIDVYQRSCIELF